MYSPRFVYPFIGQGTLELIPLFGYCNNSAMNMGVQISLHVPAFPFLEHIAKVELLDHMVIYF